MELLKAAPEAIAEYLTFLLQFITGPRAALQPYLTPENCPGKVHGKLVLFCALSVGVALAIGRGGEAVGMAKDSSMILGWIGRIGEAWLPVAVLLTLFVFTAVVHVIAAAMYLSVGQKARWMPLRPVSESVNAILSLASCFVPVITFLVVALRVYASHELPPPALFVAGVALLFDLALLFYFALAFAAAHAMPVGQVASLFGGVVIVVYIAAQLLLQ